VLANDRGRETVHLVRIGQVAGQVLEPASGSLRQGARHPNHLRAFRRQRFGHRRADAARCAGYQSHPASQPGHSV
jgi:hypothetical protein